MRIIWISWSTFACMGLAVFIRVGWSAPFRRFVVSSLKDGLLSYIFLFPPHCQLLYIIYYDNHVSLITNISRFYSAFKTFASGPWCLKEENVSLIVYLVTWRQIVVICLFVKTFRLSDYMGQVVSRKLVVGIDAVKLLQVSRKRVKLSCWRNMLWAYLVVYSLEFSVFQL